ncbi:CoA transferase [Frankia sp. AgPm24]|uniref:CoA transferase n=1 Tax=Frankia sp. AgPm24 TaxID=631128 RepID=UPI00200FD3E2|nr:CoA transferase [Frankia sp. AgPm24]MCK9925520.1 CoA transferase [Frankia sp. AgPm24]
MSVRAGDPQNGALGGSAARQESSGGVPRGPLFGLRVLELAGEFTAYPGKLLADLGANVVVVEPPGGAAARGRAPFVESTPHPESSVSWRHYNTSKRGIVLDLATTVDSEPTGGDDGRGGDGDLGRFERLLADCDVLLEGWPAADTAALGLDPARFTQRYPSLVWTTVAPYGRAASGPDRPVTDLTLLAGAGPVLSCGYDDHGLPPVRGLGGQAVHVGGSFAVAATLTALLYRTRSGRGQHVDVSVDAALNVTCELATTQYLADGQLVSRQTGRHATASPTNQTQVRAADGQYVVLGFPPRTAARYAALVAWIDELGLREAFPDVVLLELGVERGGVSIVSLGTDPLAQPIWDASRAAMMLLAEHLPAAEFFLGCQRRAIVAGMVASPEEAIRGPHALAREFAVELLDPHTGRVELHPGAPYRFGRTPWRISRPAPRLGEHTAALLTAGWDTGRDDG